MSPTSSDSESDPEPGWVQSLLVVLRVASTDELIQRTYRFATLGDRISDFMVYWVGIFRVPGGRNNRKLLSYSGALRYRQGMDGFLNGRGDWTDPVSQQRYFDPCNYIYSRAFHLAFPDIAETLGNAETLGDTLEGLLALKYWDDHGAIRQLPDYPHFPNGSPTARIVEWIEELVTLVWAVSLIHPVTDSPAEWASRFCLM